MKNRQRPRCAAQLESLSAGKRIGSRNLTRISIGFELRRGFWRRLSHIFANLSQYRRFVALLTSSTKVKVCKGCKQARASEPAMLVWLRNDPVLVSRAFVSQQ